MTNACKKRVRRNYLKRGRILSLPVIRAYRQCASIKKAISTCLTSVLFGGTLCAIVSVENFAPRKPQKNGDSYVFNTDLDAGGVWYQFDCSALTPIEDHLKIINKLRCDVDMQVGQL